MSLLPNKIWRCSAPVFPVGAAAPGSVAAWRKKISTKCHSWPRHCSSSSSALALGCWHGSWGQSCMDFHVLWWEILIVDWPYNDDVSSVDVVFGIWWVRSSFYPTTSNEGYQFLARNLQDQLTLVGSILSGQTCNGKSPSKWWVNVVKNQENRTHPNTSFHFPFSARLRVHALVKQCRDSEGSQQKPRPTGPSCWKAETFFTDVIPRSRRKRSMPSKSAGLAGT